MRVCRRCVLPESFPGSRLDAVGVCRFCRAQGSREENRPARGRVGARRFEQFVKGLTDRRGPQCLVAYSGGKDSTYTLMLLRRRWDLRVLAVTFDNGFLSPSALENARRAVDALDVEHLTVKPRPGLLRALFAAVAAKNPFPAKAIERASPVCNACMGLAKGIFLRLAVERRIPLVAYGWSPGQAPARAGFFRLNAAMVADMQRSRLAPMAALAGREMDDFSLEGLSPVREDAYPHSVNPLAFVEYDEGRILDEIGLLGWRPPGDTDGNSSNCLLNLLANRLHLRRFGFHPYAFEVAGLVRDGFMSREAGLAKLGDLGDRNLAAKVAERLGLEMPQ